ncbi:uncharacterized protein LY89DRAFT_777195 [Mollisia scopiformis]|uniref:DUF5672 domain-containing protein n=1 Tax=Mollisia scopiformis TaxID=149040 RepID=A0A194XTH8_MOLSC|nr:uncharacterized protein LY89DRAFT_777195 [Mollisia scopiformis]KUJ23446.1 hypothetical protein LY89DRAFT_777195 [Mollisia scopiformis]
MVEPKAGQLATKLGPKTTVQRSLPRRVISAQLNQDMLDLSSPLLRRKITACLFVLFSAICFLLTKTTFNSYPTLLQSLQPNRPSHRQSLYKTWTTIPITFDTHPKDIAVIIEDRPLSRLVPLLLHFSNVLGPRILTTSWIWEELSPADHVFLFQGDSVVCANSPYTLDDFLDYDFIAAPYDRWIGEDTSDGLSLRNRTMTLDIVKAVDFGDLTQPTNPHFDVVKSEEQWLTQKMKDISASTSSGLGPRLPSKDAATKFSVGRMWHARAFGYQQLADLSPIQRQELDVWCPEHRLAIESLPFDPRVV